jgi:hypothetical protein
VVHQHCQEFKLKSKSFQQGDYNLSINQMDFWSVHEIKTKIIAQDRQDHGKYKFHLSVVFLAARQGEHLSNFQTLLQREGSHAGPWHDDKLVARGIWKFHSLFQELVDHFESSESVSKFQFAH